MPRILGCYPGARGRALRRTRAHASRSDLGRAATPPRPAAPRRKMRGGVDGFRPASPRDTGGTDHGEDARVDRELVEAKAAGAGRDRRGLDARRLWGPG